MTGADPTILRRDDATALEQRLGDLLDAAAEAAGHPFRSEKLCLEAEVSGQFAGGLSARIGTHWMMIEMLAVAPESRGKGIGRALMAEAEAVGQARGLLGIWLDSYSFQAPRFYEKLGYAEFGRIDDYPPGASRHFLAKRL